MSGARYTQGAEPSKSDGVAQNGEGTRCVTVSFKVRDGERRLIEMVADFLGQSRSGFVRDCVLPRVLGVMQGLTPEQVAGLEANE